MIPNVENAFLAPEELAKRVGAVYERHRDADGVAKMNGMNLVPIAGLKKNGSNEADPSLPFWFKQQPMVKGRYAKYGISDMALDMMKAMLPTREDLKKSSLTVSSGLTWYDLHVPALHQIPWLTPLRDKMPRKQMPKAVLYIIRDLKVRQLSSPTFSFFILKKQPHSCASRDRHNPRKSLF